jgi:hypothetical protein
MTLSERDRLANLEAALSLMMEEVGDKAIDVTLFDPKAATFGGIYQTTWKDLERRRWVEGHREKYRLTGRGWIRALQRLGTQFVERLRRLAGTLKYYVKGRNNDEVVALSEVARDANLPEGWVFNVIEVNLLDKLSRKFRASGATWSEKGRLVLIPCDFGIDPVDIPDDLFSAVEQLKNSLSETEECLTEVEGELAEYRCTWCRAPLSETIQIPLDEEQRDWGIREVYACGLDMVDKFVQQPCPSDPKFPKLEDFELCFKENSSETLFKWTCYAKPKTKYAQKLRLMREVGRTKQEAQQSLAAQYERMARPWRG